VIPVTAHPKLEFHGTEYGGWPIASGSLSEESVVVDIGLGEDISFSESLIRKYRCNVFGFDPTPKAIAYVRARNPPNFLLFEMGVDARRGNATFYLPNVVEHASGSVCAAPHLGASTIVVPMIAIEDVLVTIGVGGVDLLKMDIEGSEYAVVQSEGFEQLTRLTKQICIEFHHRWRRSGKADTLAAIQRLAGLGFEVAWVSNNNEEILFVRNGELTRDLGGT